MIKSEIYADILRAYDRDKTEAETSALHRQNKLYNEIPRLAEIQKEINNTGMSIAEIFVNGGDREKGMQLFKEKCNMLNVEKNKILVDNGYASDYLEPKYKCIKCKDTGYINNKRCDCFKKKLIDVYYNMSNISKIIADENFDNFNINLYSENISEDGVSARDNIKKIFRDVMFDINDIENKPFNFLFTGRSGLGKTFMCNCISKYIMDKGSSVIYMSAYKLFDAMLKQRFNKDNDSDSHSLLYDCDLLVIDDLGTEGVNSATTAEFFDIINSRLLDKKSTVISTNMSLLDINSTYSERLASRILGNYKCFRFFGEDLRIFK